VVGAALAGGSLELGKGSTVSVAVGYARSLPFTVIGGISWYSTDHRSSGFVVLANSPYKDAKDLAGQTLAAVSLRDLGSVSTFAWLDQRGVDWRAIKYLEIPVAATLAAMEGGRVAGAAVYEPHYSAFLATGKVRTIGYPLESIAPRFAEAVLFGNPSWVNSHRRQVERFLRVMADASTYVAAHESELIPLMAQFTGAEPAALARIVHPGRGVALNVGDLQPVIDTLARFKVIPDVFPAQDLICTCALRH
jgi:ABC-type nitrate/sulfonate/bicarbonate transport system substrate-binding protein